MADYVEELQSITKPVFLMDPNAKVRTDVDIAPHEKYLFNDDDGGNDDAKDNGDSVKAGLDTETQDLDLNGNPALNLEDTATMDNLSMQANVGDLTSTQEIDLDDFMSDVVLDDAPRVHDDDPGGRQTRQSSERNTVLVRNYATNATYTDTLHHSVQMVRNFRYCLYVCLLNCLFVYMLVLKGSRSEIGPII